MRVPRIAVATLILACALPCSLQAQNPPQAIKMQFVCFPKQANIEPLELLLGRETLEIAAPGHEFSPEYKVPPLSQVVIGKTVQGEDGKPRFDVYGKAKGISSPDQLILLIRKGREPSDGFVVMPMDARGTSFPGGSFLFINASTKNVGCEIGDKAFALEPGKQNLVRPKATHEAGACQATFSFERQDKTAKKFYDTRWSTDESYRTMVFFFDLKDKVGIQPIINVLPYTGNPTPP